VMGVKRRLLGQADVHTEEAPHDIRVNVWRAFDLVVFNAVFLERACRNNLRALMAGGPKTWSDDEEALAKREHVYSPQAAWDYLARRLGAG